jgi:carbon-monoxide dehydrogenase small subunit
MLRQAQHEGNNVSVHAGMTRYHLDRTRPALQTRIKRDEPPDRTSTRYPQARFAPKNLGHQGESSMTYSVSMTVNGKAVRGEVEGRTLLVQFLRETLRLTGTHVGCDTSQCGACVVHVNGTSVKSCTLLAVQAEGAQVTTIEGLAKGDELHPMQAAFRENHGLQCGYCTPGMVMSAIDLVKENPTPSEKEIREWLEGNLCRCTGYHNIVKSIEAGAKAMRGG